MRVTTPPINPASGLNWNSTCLPVLAHHFSKGAQLAIDLVNDVVCDGDISHGFRIAASDGRGAHRLTSLSSSIYLLSIRLLSSGRMSRRIIVSASSTDCSATKARS